MTGHKTVALFLSYVHPDERRVRRSVEKVSAERRKLANRSKQSTPDDKQLVPVESTNPSNQSTALGKYRPQRREVARVTS
jgi:hypothetical protein